MNTQPQELSISEHAQKLGVLATQLGYQGALTVGALEDEIRFYQQRSVEAVMELGKRLLILKEMTPHGEFSKRIEMLGISKRTAQRFMSVVLKFSKTTSMSLLEKSGNGTKLLELMVLDDDDIEIIDAGGSIGDVSLDTIEIMSVRELKKALREAKSTIESKDQDLKAKDQVIQKKDQKMNELDEKLTKFNSPAEIQKRAETEDQQLEKAALETLSAESLTLLNAVMRYQNAINSVLDLANEKGIGQLYERVDESVIATYQRIAQFSQSLGTQVDFENMVSPEWLFPNASHTESEEE
jgi:Sec-independent protein translocase protein TatA